MAKKGRIKLPSPERLARAAAARENRIVRWGARIEYLGRVWQRGAKMTMETRLKLVGQLLRDRIVINIAIPVTKYQNSRGTISVTDRSKPGEYPRADTTRLMKDIFWKLMDNGKEVRVGTTLDYGLRLELFMDRSFLLRTFREVQYVLANTLTKGQGASVQFQVGKASAEIINIPPV